MKIKLLFITLLLLGVFIFPGSAEAIQDHACYGPSGQFQYCESWDYAYSHTCAFFYQNCNICPCASSEGGYSQGGYQSGYQSGYPTPTPIPPDLRARVYVDTNDDGTGDVQYSGSDPARVNLSGRGGQDAPGYWSPLVMGQTYTLNLGLPSGYITAGSDSGTRSVTVRNRNEVRTFSIRRNLWKVAARVMVDNNGDGYGDTNYTSSTNPSRVNLQGHGGFNNSHTWDNVSPGTYELNLGLPVGYRHAGSEDGNRNVVISDSNKGYTFSITRNVYRVTANVEVDTDGNGTSDTNYTSSTNPARVNLSGHGGFDNSHTWTSVAPGTYTLQLGLPTGYALGCADDGNRSVTVGPDKSFTFCIVRSVTPTPTPTRTPTPTGTPTSTPTNPPTPVVGIPNLIVSSLSPTGGRLEVGWPVGLEGVIRNNSSVSTGVSSQARFCVYNDLPDSTKRQTCYTSTTGRLGTDITTNALGAGSSDPISSSTTRIFPTAGTYTAYLCADVTDAINEGSDTAADNCLSETFEILAGPPPPATADISGNIYVETDGVAGITGSDSLYSSATPLTISYQNITDGVTTGSTQTTNGNYTLPNLPTGRYIVTFSQTPPPGYGISPSPSSFTIEIGLPCQPLPPSAVNNGAAIDCTTGSVSNLNFALTNYEPWIQSVSLDNRFDNGFPNKIPSAPACGGFASVTGSSSTPGVIFTGDENSVFSPGRANNQDWVAGGNTDPEIFNPSGALRTSYAALNTTITSIGKPTTPLTSVPLCTDYTNCRLNPSTNGVYTVGEPGNPASLTITDGDINGNKQVVVLVNGPVTINGPINVDPGSFLLISALGDITVSDTVGAAPSCNATPQLEGIYVTDNNFVIEGNNDCSAGSDLMLTLAGSIVVNAARGSGELDNGRTLCTQNADYPTLRVNERADFLLNAPDYIQSKTTVWREVAP